MAALRRVHYGVGIAVGLAVVVLAIPSQQGIPSVFSNSPGLIFGNGRAENPLNVVVAKDGVSVTGTGSAGSPLSATGVTASLDFGLFGDGVDGSSAPCGVISVDTQLSRSVYCTSLTVNSGVTLDPHGWRIYVKGTLQLDGKISRNGNNGSGGTGGAALVSNEVCGSGGGGAGANAGGNCGGGSPTGNCQGQGALWVEECSTSGGAGGATNVAGTSGVRCKGGGGGGGSSGASNGAGCGGANASLTTGRTGSFRAPYTAFMQSFATGRGAGTGSPYISFFGGGSGGGGGGFSNGTSGGGGGSGGGNIFISARQILGTGAIEAKGGNGANGGNGGGGGGGGGGIVTLIIGTGSFPTIDVSGGNGGTGTTSGGIGGPGFVVKFKAGV